MTMCDDLFDDDVPDVRTGERLWLKTSSSLQKVHESQEISVKEENLYYLSVSRSLSGRYHYLCLLRSAR